MAIQTLTTTFTKPGEINIEFKTFCSTLYTSEVMLNADSCQNYELLSLSSQDSEKLVPIILEELRKALVSMKKGKSTDWDGIPPELYLAFWDIPGPPMLDMINTAIDKSFQLRCQHCNNHIIT